MLFLSCLAISLLLSCCTLTLRLSLHGLYLHTGQFRIDEDTAAVLADDDFLVHLDIELALWRNLVEATTAGVTLHIHDAKTVAGRLTNTLEAGQQTRFNFRLQLLGFLLELSLCVTSPS